MEVAKFSHFPDFGTMELPDKGDYLILYARLVFLVTVKSGSQNLFLIPDPLGNHRNIPEHNDE